MPVGFRSILGAAFLAFLGSIPLGLSPSMADQFTRLSGRWQLYVNERYGTEFAFPDNLFDAAPARGDRAGRRFIAPDATLELLAWTRHIGDTPASLQEALLSTEGYEAVLRTDLGRH